MAKRKTEVSVDAVYKDYSGKKRFRVEHPDVSYPMFIAAPDENSAIVAAAERLGRRWNEYAFYAYCNVMQI